MRIVKDARSLEPGGNASPPPPICDLFPVIARIVELLPLPEGEMGEVFAGARPASAPRSLDELAGLCRSHGGRVPFRVVRRGGVVLAVAPDGVRTFDIVTAAAVRMVQHRGFASVPSLASRAETLSSTSLSVTMVRRVLAASPRIRWLDDAAQMGWFSFVGNGSRAETALRKIFAISAGVAMADLQSALGKCLPELMEAPQAVLRRYLLGIGGCDVEGGVVSRASEESMGAAILSPAEAKLVRILAANGGGIAAAALRKHAAKSVLSDATLTQLLRFSPLVFRTRDDHLRLIGDLARLTVSSPGADRVPATPRAPETAWKARLVHPSALPAGESSRAL
jgi:hypothetical protein